METIRAFVASPVSTLATAERARQAADEVAPEAFRWVKELHVTYVFLGGVEADTALAVAKSLSELTAPQLRACYSGLIALPRWSDPRVLALPVLDETGRLGELQREIAARCRALGLPVEKRPFLPHVTLGRLRPRARPALDRLKSKAQQFGGERLDLDTVCLFRSRLTRDGARYEELFSCALTG